MRKRSPVCARISKSSGSGHASCNSVYKRAHVRSDKVLLVDEKPLRSEDVRVLIQQRLMDFNCSGDEIIVAGGEQATDPASGSGASGRESRSFSTFSAS